MKFGEFDKAEEKYGVGGGTTEWMKLAVGDNKVRLLTEFEDYGDHWSNEHNRSFTCLGEEDCVFCKKNAEAEENGKEIPSPTKVKYLGWVIDRADGNIKLLRIGHQIFKQIGQLAVNDEYEFEVVPEYDLTIKREGTGLETSYSVIAARKNTKLKKAEKEALKELSEPGEIVERLKQGVLSTMVEDWGMDIYNDDGDVEIEDVEDIPF